MQEHAEAGQGDVGMQVNALREVVARLEHQSDRLINRLAMVLGPPEPTPGHALTAEDAILSPLGDELRQIARQADRVSDALVAAIERLQL